MNAAPNCDRQNELLEAVLELTLALDASGAIARIRV
jgi:hypothetical protein